MLCNQCNLPSYNKIIGSLLSGKIEYYTFKTVAIGTELLVFYGNEYFTELGYLVEEDEPEIGKFYFSRILPLCVLGMHLHNFFSSPF